jgi:hypothetical protein
VSAAILVFILEWLANNLRRVPFIGVFSFEAITDLVMGIGIFFKTTFQRLPLSPSSSIYSPS